MARLVIEGFDDELFRRLKMYAAWGGGTLKDVVTVACEKAVSAWKTTDSRDWPVNQKQLSTRRKEVERKGKPK